MDRQIAASILSSWVFMTSVVACGVADIPEVPDDPTYEDHVLPLFSNHCILCHGSVANRGAPDYFRLDIYEDQQGIAGARTMGLAALWAIEADRMPIAAQWGDGLGPNGKELVRRWVAQGRPR